MGNLCLSSEEREALKRSQALDKESKNAFKMEQEKVKLFLLGAGESGKTTIFKQMKLLYGTGTTIEERKASTSVIFGNIMTAIKILIEQSAILEIPLKCKDAADIINEHESTPVSELKLNGPLGQAIKTLWQQDTGLHAIWELRSQFHIVESTKFYLDKIDEIIQDDYIASENDILYARVRTSGIVTERYNIDGALFEMYDVGGQRNERRKWIHCFDSVTAIIFVAALSEYDQQLFEDTSTNRMVEAINLFKDICNNQFFKDSSIILFLNKKDLFETKICKKNISDVDAFQDYTGGLGNYTAGVDYFLQLFLAVNDNPDKSIYHHVTCATDTKNVQVVFDACKDIIIRGSLKDSGLMD